MLKQLFSVLCLLVLFASVGCQPMPSSAVNIQNTNAPSAENSLIRVWLLSEEQIKSPPTTRSEAEQVPFVVTAPGVNVTFSREPGTYFIVASNETQFQSLAGADAFEAGVDFSLLEVSVGEDQIIDVSVSNTATPTLLPDIQQL